MKLLITGGAGFIAGNLIPLLNREGDWEITVLDNETVGCESDLEGMDVARFIHGDIRDRAAVDEAMAGQDAVVHLAAQTGVIPSIESPVEDCDINVAGTLALLEGARRHGVKRFVNASSSAPVGATPPPMREDLPARPVSPYGASKLAAEGYCSAYFHSFGVETVSLRFSNCYGPGSRNKSSAVALFMKLALAGEPITVYGDGEQTRDFIFVGDLCQAIRLALGEPVEETGDSPFGQVYQVATATETTINSLIGLISPLVEEGLGRPLEVRYEPARKGEVIRNYSDIGRFVAAFGFAPAVSLADGVRRTWDYFLREEGGEGPSPASA